MCLNKTPAFNQRIWFMNTHCFATNDSWEDPAPLWILIKAICLIIKAGPICGVQIIFLMYTNNTCHIRADPWNTMSFYSNYPPFIPAAYLELMNMQTANVFSQQALNGKYEKV